MQKYIIYTAYGWLTLTGILHFIVDVASQYLRSARAPGLETTLYYGLNSAFSLGKIVFGLFGLFLAWRAMDLMNERFVQVLAIVAGLGWLAITFLFMEYWQPKFNAGIFCALVIAAFLIHRP